MQTIRRPYFRSPSYCINLMHKISEHYIWLEECPICLPGRQYSQTRNARPFLTTSGSWNSNLRLKQCWRLCNTICLIMRGAFGLSQCFVRVPLVEDFAKVRYVETTGS